MSDRQRRNLRAASNYPWCRFALHICVWYFDKRGRPVAVAGRDHWSVECQDD